jgi:hypothetical protein
LGVVGVGSRIAERESWGLFEASEAENELLRRLFSSLGTAADSEGELNQVRWELSVVQGELSRRDAQLDDILNSKSWKIAEFLRKCHEIGRRCFFSDKRSKFNSTE